MTIVGCMDHCLDLFLKDCKDIMQVNTLLLLLLHLALYLLLWQVCRSVCSQCFGCLQVDEAIKIAADIVNYYTRNGVANSMLLAQRKVHKVLTYKTCWPFICSHFDYI